MSTVVQDMPQRAPLSCNSAADFVTLHGQEALGREVVLVEGTSYDPELDKFRPTAELPKYVHYADFQERVRRKQRKKLTLSPQ